ncbi:TetR/AcrR family transcriptional regulator [Kibdelosporangium aridum]|uniref:TetR/AcrR family transcriptional regulator n=1 Tax=Kibdelosporangium aridum TaxID=2030 RepID=A0A428Z7U5_KIBAR|nr:TetR/AcrR family transcriptional regulator [Kibdelosporangium aridum]RSM83876.1 TetR/AcrR family transcriptional regulator [Kibdelosporangium aridum]
MSDIPSVWARPKKGREQPALSREQIVSEAIKLLDSEGLDALSMRNLGKRLDAGATSLYRHVANKDELIELAIDEVYGEIEVPAPETTEWRAGVVATTASVRAMINRHPWIAAVLGQVGLSFLGPNVMRMSDRMLALFEQGGFGLLAGNRAMRLVLVYVIGAGIGEAAWLTSLARSGLTEKEWEERVLPIAKATAAPYPRLLAAFETPDEEDQFAYGLDALLDGLVAKRA